MSVAVACLTLHHDAGFVPAAAGHVACLAATNHLSEVFLAAEEHLDVLVQAATTVEANVDDDAILLVVLTHYLTVDLAVALVVHRLDVNITQASSRQAINQVCVTFYPALVEQVVHSSVGNGKDYFFKCVTSLVAQGHQGLLACQAIEQLSVVVLIVDFDAVDFLYNHAWTHLASRAGKRTFLYHLIYLESLAGVGPVKEQSHIGCCLTAIARIVATA